MRRSVGKDQMAGRDRCELLRIRFVRIRIRSRFRSKSKSKSKSRASKEQVASSERSCYVGHHRRPGLYYRMNGGREGGYAPTRNRVKRKKGTIDGGFPLARTRLLVWWDTILIDRIGREEDG
jgi:hypothetical protein